MAKAKKAAKAAPKAAAKEDNRKLTAILAYIIWIVALILYLNKKDKYVGFHIRQGLIILLAVIPVYILGMIPFIGWFVIWPLGCLAILILSVMGIISAVNETEKEVPVIGKLGQSWFKGL